MELTKKQSEVFANWYIERYWKKDENGKLIAPVNIPILPASTQREEIKEWILIIYKVLGKSKSKQLYKYRELSNWKKYRESFFEKVFNSLYLQYWPTFKEEDWSPAKENLWCDAVIDIKKFLKTFSIEDSAK